MNRFLLIVAAAALVLIAGCSDDTECPTCPDPAPSQNFVGSATCGTAGCHDSVHTVFIQSGHPFKLSEVVGGVGPTYPWDNEHTSGAIVSRDGPPPTTAWNQFAYVIGGFYWKARWVQTDGQVYVTGAQAQLNLQAAGPEWVPYNSGNPKAYNYSCFKCHTTGAVDQGSWPAGSTGFGTFAFGGVQCEECHGEGAQHASDPVKFNMTVDRSSELCGQCHTRDAQNRVAVSGGWIRHHEQYDEMIHSPHAAVGCGGCHDPHSSVVYDNVAAGQGVSATCESCHTGYTAALNHSSVARCEDCHMSKAAKSARVTSNPYVADVSSHTFMIESQPWPKDSMWTSDGSFLRQDEFGRGRVTLDFACYSCHKDDPTAPTNPTAQYSDKTLGQLSTKAPLIHP